MEDGKKENNKIKPIVALFDADFIPYYVCHNKKDQPIKSLEDCINMCDNLIYNINNSIKAQFYAGFLTTGKCFRYNINPNYKSNRKYENQPEYLDEIKDYLQFKHGFKGQEGYEADDLVVSFKAQNNQFETIIISPDKDILGSVDNAYNPRKNEFIANSNEQIERNFWKSMVTGDTIDGIKGIPGKGEAYFNKYEEYCLSLGFRNIIFDLYIGHFGEYEGIKEFTKNYLSLKLVDNVQLEEVKLNKVTEVTFL